MQLFLKLFEPYLQWFYHCFDRLVINGHLLGLMRESQIVYFFRDVGGHPKLTKELLRQRSQHYQNWVEHFARNHKVPLIWAEKHVRKEDLVASRRQRRLAEAKFGVYYIIKSREQGWTFRILPPRFATSDPNYQIVRKHRSLYTHYYFYILDRVAGPMVLRVGSFLPFALTAYLNGHNFIERQLARQGIRFVKDDNRFVSVAQPARLQAAADRLDAPTIQQRIDYWAYILAPKFSAMKGSVLHFSTFGLSILRLSGSLRHMARKLRIQYPGAIYHPPSPSLRRDTRDEPRRPERRYLPG